MYSKPCVKLAKGCLLLPLLVTEFTEVYTEFQVKPAIYPYNTYETRFCDYVHNSMHSPSNSATHKASPQKHKA